MIRHTWTREIGPDVEKSVKQFEMVDSQGNVVPQIPGYNARYNIFLGDYEYYMPDFTRVSHRNSTDRSSHQLAIKQHILAVRAKTGEDREGARAVHDKFFRLSVLSAPCRIGRDACSGGSNALFTYL